MPLNLIKVRLCFRISISENPFQIPSDSTQLSIKHHFFNYVNDFLSEIIFSFRVFLLTLFPLWIILII